MKKVCGGKWPLPDLSEKESRVLDVQITEEKIKKHLERLIKTDAPERTALIMNFISVSRNS